ncbi:phage major capsid protein [Luteimonas sp. A478]
MSHLVNGPQSQDIRNMRDAIQTEFAAGRGAETVGVIASSLAETKEVVGEMLNGWKDFTQSQAGLRTQLQVLEQHVAKLDTEGGSYHSDAGPSIGTRAMDSLREDPAFAAAAEAVGRGMKPSQFAARINLDGSIKAALTNEGRGREGDTGIPGQSDHRGLVGPVQRPLRLLDVLPSRPTTRDSVEFIQISATGDAAEQIEEGDEKAELEVAGTAQIANIVTIAAWTSASRQVLADQAALAQQVDRVIRHKVLTRLEHQIINGPGGDGRINGLLNQATVMAPAIGETPADRIGESLVTLANNGYQPGLIVMNPMDWYRLQITRKNATDEEYVFGSPTAPAAPSLWNTPIVRTPSMPAGQALTLDTGFVTVLDREQLTVMASNTHADFFIRNLVAILGEMRAGLEVLDTDAVHKFDLTD